MFFRACEAYGHSLEVVVNPDNSSDTQATTATQLLPTITFANIVLRHRPGQQRCPLRVEVPGTAGGTAVFHNTEVHFPNTTPAGTYVVTFSAVSGKFNDSTTATFIKK
jgi:hypothetical protein